MPVKEVPVPTGEDAVEEAIEELAKEPIPEFVPEPKVVKEDDHWTKVVPKSRSSGLRPKARAKKEEPPKVDLKQRMPCPICKKLYTLHSLLYTHQCTKDAREAKQKKSTLIGGDLKLTPEKVIEKPVPLPEPEVIEEAVPEPPTLVRPPVQMSYREALLERRFAIEARQREIHTSPIRNYFGRS